MEEQKGTMTTTDDACSHAQLSEEQIYMKELGVMRWLTIQQSSLAT